MAQDGTAAQPACVREHDLLAFRALAGRTVTACLQPGLLEVATNDIDEFFGAKSAVTVAVRRGIRNVEPDVVLEDLRHEAIECAAGGSNQLQNIDT